MLRAVSALHGPVAVVHFDAHLDTWDTYFDAAYTHGTPFRRAAEEGLLDPTGCLHVGIRGPLYTDADLDQDSELGFQVIPTPDVEQLGVPGMVERILSGSATGRSMSRSTSTCSTRHTHPAPGPRRRRPHHPGTAGHAAIIRPAEPGRRQHRRGRSRLRLRPDHRHRRRARRLRTALRRRSDEGRPVSATRGPRRRPAPGPGVRAGRHRGLLRLLRPRRDLHLPYQRRPAGLPGQIPAAVAAVGGRGRVPRAVLRLHAAGRAGPRQCRRVSHDVTTVIRTRTGEQTLTERETIVFRRDGDRWTAVHEHLSPQPGPAAVPEPLETGGTATA